MAVSSTHAKNVVYSDLYNLEPGDRTSYHFMLSGFYENANSILTAGAVIPGIQKGYDYLHLAIFDFGGHGIIPRDRVDLIYAMAHGFGHTDQYALAAVLLASYVLAKNPTDKVEAMRLMLGAPMLIEGVPLDKIIKAQDVSLPDSLMR